MERQQHQIAGMGAIELEGARHRSTGGQIGLAARTRFDLQAQGLHAKHLGEKPFEP